MKVTICDRCRANSEQPGLTITPIKASIACFIKFEEWSEPVNAAGGDPLTAKTYADDDGCFELNVDLCKPCQIELAAKLVAFMEAHKS